MCSIIIELYELVLHTHYCPSIGRHVMHALHGASVFRMRSRDPAMEPPTQPAASRTRAAGCCVDSPPPTDTPRRVKRGPRPLGARVCDRLLFDGAPAATVAQKQTCCGAAASVAISCLVPIMATVRWIRRDTHLVIDVHKASAAGV